MVRHLQHSDIDKSKWDECIATAYNSLVYGYSFYLDAVAGEWNAVVVNDYEAVMPLVWRRKFFITYLYQPAFTQQLGLFCKQPQEQEVYNEIEALLFSQYRFAEIFLNYGNNGCFRPGYCKQQVNYVVDINKAYDAAATAYLPGFAKSLRRIAKFNFQYRETEDIDEAITLYRQLYSNRVQHLNNSDYNAFKYACIALQQRLMLVIRKAVDENGNILALSLLFKDTRRLYNIISCITEKGRPLEVNYFLYDAIIREFCNKGLVFDLEGSDIKGVAEFYIKMNPVNQPYEFYKYNHLHPLLRLVKK